MKTLKLTWLLLLCVISQNLLAYDFAVGGFCYEYLSMADLTCRVSSSSSSLVTSSFIIPSKVEYNGLTFTVTEIGEGALQNRKHLQSVYIPNTVTSIGKSSFSGCTGLTTIEIPNSVITIGDEAFSQCENLISIVIPNSVTTIGQRAFSDCYNLQSVAIPNSVTAISNYAFRSCI